MNSYPLSLRPEGSAEFMEAKIADVYTILNGKVTRMQAFTDRQAALKYAESDR